MRQKREEREGSWEQGGEEQVGMGERRSEGREKRRSKSRRGSGPGMEMKRETEQGERSVRGSVPPE